MTKTKKITLGSLATIAILATPAIAVVSCGSTANKQVWVSEKFQKELDEVTFNNWNDTLDLNKITINHYEGKIKRWVDGDTLVITTTKPVSNETEFKVRVAQIDTPESHAKIDGVWQDTTGEEKKWADKATEYGKKTLPVGTKIYFVSNGKKTYDRIAGNILFGSDITKLKSYSVGIIKEGLALPFISDASVATFDTNLLHYNGLALADAYNWALKNKAGLFSKNLYDILGIHGATNDLAVRYRKTKRTLDDTMNIYDVLGIKK